MIYINISEKKRVTELRVSSQPGLQSETLNEKKPSQNQANIGG